MTGHINSFALNFEETGSGIAMYFNWLIHGDLINFVGAATLTKRIIQIFWILGMTPRGQPLKGLRLSFWHNASLLMALAGPAGSSEPNRFVARFSCACIVCVYIYIHPIPSLYIYIIGMYIFFFRVKQLIMWPRPFDSPTSFSLLDDSTLLHAQCKSWICTSCLWKRFVSKAAMIFEICAFIRVFVWESACP